MAAVIGIDLGTTNSCVAVFEGGERVIIPNSQGGRTTPSVVAFTKNGERLVGATAKRQAVTNPDRTISSIKRDMGTRRRINIDGKTYSPEEISAIILSSLKADAEAYLGTAVTEAVITVPAYFSDAQRQATKDAGKIAGLEVKRIINEPTAAALAYGIDKEQSQKIMVYDLGGGTFDVSVLDIAGGVIEVLSTSGNNRLGGDDFDRCVTDWLIDGFMAQYHIDLRRDPAAVQRIREAAEKAKIELSSLTTTDITLPFISATRSGPIHLETTLTRAKFNELTAHLVHQTECPVTDALRESGLSFRDISKVLMVGGSGRIPAVLDTVRRLSGKEPYKGINPDECVAMGACLQGGVLSGTVGGLLLLDVTPLSLGIETVGGNFTRLIERNTTIPITKSQVFSTAAPFQRDVEINVLQGERAMAAQNKSLGRFRLGGIRPAPAGVPQIQVTFNIDANGIVNVSARDLDTGKQQDITIQGSGNMSQSDIDAAIRDAQQYAAEDEAIRARGAAASELEQALRRAEALKKDKSTDRATRRALDSAARDAVKALKKRDTAEMLAAKEALDRLTGTAP